MAGVTRWKRRLDSVLSHFVKDVDELDAEVLQVRLGGGWTPGFERSARAVVLGGLFAPSPDNTWRVDGSVPAVSS